MKRPYLTVVFLFLGTAAGFLGIAPIPGAIAAPPIDNSEKPQPVAASRAPEPTMAVTKVPASRPPVPLLWTSRPTPPAKTPDVEIAPREVSSTATDANAPDTPETKPQTEAFAKAAIERDGYKGVRALTKGSDGLWRGRALRGTTEVAVSVDATGNVSAR